MSVIDLPALREEVLTPKGSRPSLESCRLVAITDIGLTTALGSSARETWDALMGGRFITDHLMCPIPRNSDPRAIQLALHAAREALSGKSLYSDARTALVVGTSKGAIESWMPNYAHSAPADLSDVAGFTSGLGEVASRVAQEFNLTGPRLTISGACASSLQALIRGAMMIRSGEVDRALIVAAESSLHPLFIGSFKRLGVLPPAGAGCRPFDERRAGFVMSEASAAVLLEVDDCMESAGREDSETAPRVCVEHVAVGNDSTHLTGADPDAKVMKRLLADVIWGEPVDLIHAHGTGTVNNDPAELAAIESVLPETTKHEIRPAIYSHKGALGHSLGAAGLIAVVINAIAHAKGIIPPNVQTRHPLPMDRVELHQTRHQRQINRSVALAAGFGGACAAVSLVSR